MSAPAAPSSSPDPATGRPWYPFVLPATAVTLCAIRLLVAAKTGLVDDEAYYRIWSLAPSLSYLDHPPMIAWIIGAGRTIAGDTTLGVRLLAPILHLAGVALLWRTAFLLYGRNVATAATWMLLAMPLLAIGGILVTPDLPSVLFAGLVLWSLAELDHSENGRWWLAVGLFAGCGLLSKYTNLFLGATILLWLVTVPANRRWFRSPYPWLGGLIAGLLASPVVIWNAEHGWASFTKQFGRVTHNGTGGLQYLVEFAGAYLALASPVIAVLSIVGLARVVRDAIRTRASSDVLIAATVLPMLLYFLAHAFHDRVQGNWPAPIYPALAICAAVGLGAISSSTTRRALFVGATAIGFVMSAAIFVHAWTPVFAAHVKREPTQQMRGWPQFAEAIERRRQDAHAGWVATTSYALAGQLAFALRNKADVIQLDERLRYEFLPTPSPAVLTQPALYIALKGKAAPELLRAKFAKVESLEPLKRDDGSAEGATYELYLVAAPPKPPL